MTTADINEMILNRNFNYYGLGSKARIDLMSARRRTTYTQQCLVCFEMFDQEEPLWTCVMHDHHQSGDQEDDCEVCYAPRSACGIDMQAPDSTLSPRFFVSAGAMHTGSDAESLKHHIAQLIESIDAIVMEYPELAEYASECLRYNRVTAASDLKPNLP